MKILGLLLNTHRLEAQKDFYVRTLSLPLVETTESAFAVQAGDTKLVFTLAEAGLNPSYYFAFKVAQERFASIKDQLSQRVTLLKRQGRDVFETTVQKAQAVYCSDPANNLLAVMAERGLLDQKVISANPLNILGVSEVGVAVDDVNSIAQYLQSTLGISAYANNPSLLTAVGSEDGRFIIVKRGQPWFPTDDLRAEVYPLSVTVAGTVYATDKLADYPYYIQTGKTSFSKRST